VLLKLCHVIFPPSQLPTSPPPNIPYQLNESSLMHPAFWPFRSFYQFRDIILHTTGFLLSSHLIFQSNLYARAQHHLLFTGELCHSVFHKCCMRLTSFADRATMTHLRACTQILLSERRQKIPDCMC